MPTRDVALAWQALFTPKRGNTPEEYEDAFAAEPALGRFAVADGASECSFAGLWARLLVQHVVGASNGLEWNDEEWLQALRQHWSDEVDMRPLPWYAETKREQGAFATLLLLTLQPPSAGKTGHWHAVTVGDSCLFRVREGRLLAAFPLEASSEFGRNPELVGSRSTAPQVTPQQAHGECRSGEQYLLMTDALARWFLRASEEGNRPWEAVAAVCTESS